MNQELILSIKLTTVLEKDQKTGFFTAFYEQFPKAMAYGKTEEDAQNRLTNICQIMFNERKEEIKQELIDNYINSNQLNNINLNLNMVNA